MKEALAYARSTAYATAGLMYDLRHLPDSDQRRLFHEYYHCVLTPQQRREIDHMSQNCAGLIRRGTNWAHDKTERHQTRTRVARAMGNLTPASEILAHDREQHSQTPAERRSAGTRAGQDPGDDDPHPQEPNALGLHASPALLQARIRKNISGTARALLIEEFIAGVLGAAQAGPLYVRIYDGDEIGEHEVDLLLAVHVGEPTGGEA